MTLVRRLLLPLVLMMVALLAACGEEGGDDVQPDSGTVTVDSGAVTTDGGKKAFGASCMGNTECETGLCFNFNMDGQRCTKPCTTATAATACAPSTFGCSGMMVCKIR